MIKNLEEKKGDIRLMVEKATDKDMTAAQKKTVGEQYAISIVLTVNGEIIHTLNGVADITVDVPWENANVFYVREDGSLEKIPSRYNPDAEEVGFSVDHFSIYLIHVDQPPVPFHIDAWWVLIIALFLMYFPLMYVRWHERD